MFSIVLMNAKALTPKTSIVIRQVVIQLSSELGNCQPHSALPFFKLFCLLNSLNIPKMTSSITGMSLFQRGVVSNFLFILYSDQYFTYLWDLFDSYYHPVKQSEHFVKVRRAQKKTERSHFRQHSPCSLSSFHLLHSNIQ